METYPITLALKDSSRGYEISPARVPAVLLAEFSKDVIDFIKGSGRQDVSSIEVSIKEGSLAIVADNISIPSVFHDLKTIESSGDLSRIDSKRRAFVEKWQSRAKKTQGLAVRITTKILDRDLVISRSSDYKNMGTARLVNVERYIRGEIQDLGGVSTPNAHVLTADGQKLTIKTTRDLVRSEPKNRVYQDAHMRIRGKLNLDTNELVDIELISFVEYAPTFTKKDMENLVAKGRQAWADVDDPAEWVRSMRGGH
ncbi:hypothetical protein H0A58_13040 [Alcaligenaceae bacterium]|nr:hypothetical protein [Alcaligenaceae bacterium]